MISNPNSKPLNISSLVEHLENKRYPEARQLADSFLGLSQDKRLRQPLNGLSYELPTPLITQIAHLNIIIRSKYEELSVRQSRVLMSNFKGWPYFHELWFKGGKFIS